MRFEICAPSVVGEVIDGEAIIMNLLSGVYFSTDGLGAQIWQGIESRASKAQLVQWVEAAYPAAPVAKDLTVFFDDLLSRELVRLADGGGPEPVLPPLVGAYIAPTLSVYEDMQDLIQLDPIHDVTEMGWPMRKVEAG